MPRLLKRARRPGALSRAAMWGAGGALWAAAGRRLSGRRSRPSKDGRKPSGPTAEGEIPPPPASTKPRRKASLAAVARESASRWVEDEAPRRGAALSYYTVFSIAPLLLVLVSVVGLFLGAEAAQGLISDQLQTVMGADKAQVVEDMVSSASKDEGAGKAAGVIGFGVLILGAGAVVGELQASLMKMWGTVPRKGGLGLLIRNRLLSSAFVLSLAFIMLVSLVINSVVSAAGDRVTASLPVSEFLIQALNLVLSVGTVAAVFALLFKYLPRARIAWGDVWIGAFATSVFFTLGNALLGVYFGKAAPTSAYGAAGSLLAVLLWTYYCAQILYFGAEFTRVYAERRGSGFARGAAPSS